MWGQCAKAGYQKLRQQCTVFILGFVCRPRQRKPARPSVGNRSASSARPHQPAVEAFDGEVLVGLDDDRRVIGIARQQADAILADLEGDAGLAVFTDSLARAIAASVERFFSPEHVF